MTLSTDIIVGFCGETDEDFAATLSLVREVGFTSLFGFKYSPRPLTPALKLPDDIPEAMKSERLALLFELSESNTRAHLATMVGTRQRVLVEGASKNGDRVQGRTERNEIVHVDTHPGHRLRRRDRRRGDPAREQALARGRRHRRGARRSPASRRPGREDVAPLPATTPRHLPLL